MRTRLTKTTYQLVASTNPIINSKLRSIDGRRNTLAGPIHVAIRVGRFSKAVLLCSHVDMDKRFSIENGKFNCASNSLRISDKLLSRMSRKIS